MVLGVLRSEENCGCCKYVFLVDLCNLFLKDVEDYYYYYYYLLLQLRFLSVAVVLTLVTNKNKCT